MADDGAASSFNGSGSSGNGRGRGNKSGSEERAREAGRGQREGQGASALGDAAGQKRPRRRRKTKGAQSSGSEPPPKRGRGTTAAPEGALDPPAAPSVRSLPPTEDRPLFPGLVDAATCDLNHLIALKAQHHTKLRPYDFCRLQDDDLRALFPIPASCPGWGKLLPPLSLRHTHTDISAFIRKGQGQQEAIWAQEQLGARFLSASQKRRGERTPIATMGFEDGPDGVPSVTPAAAVTPSAGDGGGSPPAAEGGKNGGLGPNDAEFGGEATSLGDTNEGIMPSFE